MKIGFIGFGEAAYNICFGFREQGIRNTIFAFDSQVNSEIVGGLVKKRAKETSVILCESLEEVVKLVDIFFVAVPSSYDVEVGKTIREFINKDQIYIDVSASSPDCKVEIWDLIKNKGVLFVDAAMLGSLPICKHRVPIIASGNGAKTFFDIMTPFGMSITCINGEAGAASAIKLIRSIFMKGLSTLMFEVMQCADAYDVVDAIVFSLSNSIDKLSFKEQLNNLIIGSCIHSVRRSHELAESLKLLRMRNLDDRMTTAAKEKLDLLSSYKFNDYFFGERPTDFKQILSMINKISE